MTQGLPNFDKIWGKNFHFWLPSGGTQNYIWGKLRRAGANKVFFQLSKFCRNRSIDGRDIRGQRKVGFPGPAMKLGLRKFRAQPTVPVVRFVPIFVRPLQKN